MKTILGSWSGEFGIGLPQIRSHIFPAGNFPADMRFGLIIKRFNAAFEISVGGTN
jgi:hypothetical protein